MRTFHAIARSCRSCSLVCLPVVSSERSGHHPRPPLPPSATSARTRSTGRLRHDVICGLGGRNIIRARSGAEHSVRRCGRTTPSSGQRQQPFSAAATATWSAAAAGTTRSSAVRLRSR